MNSVFKQIIAFALFLCAGYSSLAQSSCATTISASSNSICPGGYATLTASGATSFTWSPYTSSAMSSSVGTSISVYQAGVYTVTGSSGTCISTATIEIFQVSVPTITVVTTSNQVCAGYQATLTAFGASTYSWNTSASSGVTTTQSLAIGASAYSVTGANGPCISQQVTGYINIAPPLYITVTESTPTVCAGDPVTLSASGASTYSWVGGGTSSMSNPAVMIPSVSTNYTVTGYTSVCQGTGAISVAVVNCATGIPSASGENNAICVSPNPGHGIYSITTNATAHNISLEIYDVLGTRVRKVEIENDHALVNLEDLGNGVYTIRVINANKETIGYKKIIKN